MKSSRNLIIAGIVLVAAGVLLCGGTFAYLGFDMSRLSTADLVTNTYEVDEDFKDIKLTADAEDVILISSDEGNCRVECTEPAKSPHDVKVENGILTVASSRLNLTFCDMAFIPHKMETRIYLPKREYERLSVESDKGRIDIPEDFNFEDIGIDSDIGDIICMASVKGDIRINTDVGKVSLKDLTCTNLSVKGDTGKIELDGVVASGRFDIETDVGAISFKGCDANEIHAGTATGNIEGTLLTDKTFITRNHTGKVEVPDSRGGGRCELSTDTGNIRIEVTGKGEA